MKKLMLTTLILGMAAGAYAAEMGPGAFEVYRDGPMGGMPGGRYSPEFADLAVHASDLRARTGEQDTPIVPAPATGENAKTLRLRAEAAADPDKFIDEHTPEEVSLAFGLFPPRYRITDLGRIESAAVRLTVDLSRQRLIVQSPTLNAEFPISSGVLGHRTGGSGKCFAPDSMEEMHYSSLYNNAPMPHSVFFNGNIAVHATSAANEALLGQPASHGCVRLSRVNATTVFDLVRANGKGNTTICVQGAPPR